MKAIKKKNLTYKKGYLIDKETGDICNEGPLVDQYNRLMEMEHFNKFIKKNKKEIEASGKCPVYRPLAMEPTLSVPLPPSPILDKQTSEGLAYWNEVKERKSTEYTNEKLLELDRLAEFVTEDSLLFEGAPSSNRLFGNILKLDEDKMVGIVKEYADNAFLRTKVWLG